MSLHTARPRRSAALTGGFVFAATAVAHQGEIAAQPLGGSEAARAAKAAAPGDICGLRAALPTCTLLLVHAACNASQKPTKLLKMHCESQAADEHTIPVFYVPRGAQPSPSSHGLMQAKIDTLFSMYPDGLTIPAMKELVKEVRVSVADRFPVSLSFDPRPAVAR